MALNFFDISMALYGTTIYFDDTDTPMVSGQGKLNQECIDFK